MCQPSPPEGQAEQGRRVPQPQRRGLRHGCDRGVGQGGPAPGHTRRMHQPAQRQPRPVRKRPEHHRQRPGQHQQRRSAQHQQLMLEHMHGEGASAGGMHRRDQRERGDRPARDEQRIAPPRRRGRRDRAAPRLPPARSIERGSQAQRQHHPRLERPAGPRATGVCQHGRSGEDGGDQQQTAFHRKHPGTVKEAIACMAMARAKMPAPRMESHATNACPPPACAGALAARHESAAPVRHSTMPSAVAATARAGDMAVQSKRSASARTC